MKKAKIKAPKGFWELWDAKGRNEICAFANGCGPDGWKSFIPQHLTGGYPIEMCCFIHDYEYTYAADRDASDKLLRDNIKAVSKASGAPWWMRCLHRSQAGIYYWVLYWFGADNFKNGGKVEELEERSITL